MAHAAVHRDEARRRGLRLNDGKGEVVAGASTIFGGKFHLKVSWTVAQIRPGSQAAGFALLASRGSDAGATRGSVGGDPPDLPGADYVRSAGAAGVLAGQTPAGPTPS